jgi:hypothetical protein
MCDCFKSSAKRKNMVNNIKGPGNPYTRAGYGKAHEVTTGPPFEHKSVKFTDGRQMLAGTHKPTASWTTASLPRVNFYWTVYIPAEMDRTEENIRLHGFDAASLRTNGRAVTEDPKIVTLELVPAWQTWAKEFTTGWRIHA